MQHLSIYQICSWVPIAVRVWVRVSGWVPKYRYRCEYWDPGTGMVLTLGYRYQAVLKYGCGMGTGTGTWERVWVWVPYFENRFGYQVGLEYGYRYG